MLVKWSCVIVLKHFQSYQCSSYLKFLFAQAVARTARADYKTTTLASFPRLSQRRSFLIFSSGSWPQREGRGLAFPLGFAAENRKNLPFALRAREKI